MSATAFAAPPLLRADPSWHSLAFVSDLHLWSHAPRTFAAWQHWLAHTDVDALFILGDFFEVWIGDDQRDDPFVAEVIASLARFTRQRPAWFLCGNRDFLVGPDLLGACGLQALADPTRLEAFGQSLLLSHGDALCLADVDYQRFRTLVRSAAWQAGFLAKPRTERAAIARQIRNDSQGRKAGQPDPALWADVDEAEACRWLRATGTQTLIHGHTHRPADHVLGGGLARRVLTDWDLDVSPARAEALILSATGWARRPVPAAS